MPAFLNVLVKAKPMNCESQSVLKISGLPWRAMASSNTATQKSASVVFDSCQARIFRPAQSITATK